MAISRPSDLRGVRIIANKEIWNGYTHKLLESHRKLVLRLVLLGHDILFDFFQSPDYIDLTSP